MNRPGIAQAEAAAIAGMLLVALDEKPVHDEHLHASDGVLRASELPTAHFAAIDAQGCADGEVTHAELAQAFMVLDPARRRALGEDLRPLAAEHMVYKRRAERLHAVVGISFPAAAILTSMGYVVATRGVLVLGGVAFVVMAQGWWGVGRTRKAIARLIDDAFC